MLFRAAGLNEIRDIHAYGGFRPSPTRFQEGKWFATTRDDAAEWGRRMPPTAHPRPFRIVPIRIPLELMERFEARTRLDGIGPAYFVSMDVLPIVNATATISFEESADGKEHDDE